MIMRSFPTEWERSSLGELLVMLGTDNRRCLSLGQIRDYKELRLPTGCVLFRNKNEVRAIDSTGYVGSHSCA